MAGGQVMLNRTRKAKLGITPKRVSNDIKVFQNDNCKTVQYLVSCIQDIHNILPVHVYRKSAQAKDIETIKRRYKSEGLSFATLTLPKLSAGLFQYFETGHVCYPSFKIKKGTKYPVFLSELFSLATSMNSVYQVKAIKLIYQISVMFSKLKGPYPESVLDKQLADFVLVDSMLGTIDFLSPDILPILEQARLNVNALFHKNCINERAKPRPGPGATNDPVAKHMRYRPHVLYTQIDDVVPYIDFYTVNFYDAIHQTKFWRNLYNNKVPCPRARQKFVHKKVGKARGICIEQAETQYMQQAYREALYDHIENAPLTRGRINFRDQSINASLASMLSWTGEGATLDLSEASDRNARVAISYIFQDTDFHDALMALSTRYVDAVDSAGTPLHIELNKYAPMGSALCFPVMATYYWAIICALLQVKYNKQLRHIRNVYIYGDDIIVPKYLVDSILEFFPKLGLKVNKDKSFSTSHFRESCGVHAYNGVDITPVYVKHIPNSDSITVAISCLEVESQFYGRLYFKTACLFRTELNLFFNEIPVVPKDSGLFGFTRTGHFFPITLHKHRKKMDEWGNPTYRFRVVKPVQKMHSPPTEYERYLRNALTKSESSEIGGTPDQFTLVWRDVPVPQLYAYQTRPITGVNASQSRTVSDTNRSKYYESLQRLCTSWAQPYLPGENRHCNIFSRR